MKHVLFYDIVNKISNISNEQKKKQFQYTFRQIINDILFNRFIDNVCCITTIGVNNSFEDILKPRHKANIRKFIEKLYAGDNLSEKEIDEAEFNFTNFIQEIFNAKFSEKQQIKE